MDGTKLIHAVNNELEEEVRRILESERKEINHVNFSNQTALSAACYKGNLNVINMLLEHGADPSIGSNPLFEAYNGMHIDVIEWLLDHGLDPNLTNNNGETLLMVAAKEEAPESYLSFTLSKDVFKMLMRRSGVDVNVMDEQGRTLLHLATGRKKHYFLIPFLLKNGADLTRADASGQTVLFHLFDYPFFEDESLVSLAFSRLLRIYVDVNHQDSNGHTVMHQLCIKKAVELVMEDVNPQYYLIYENTNNPKWVSICNFFLQFGPDLSIKDKIGFTVYQLAACDSELFNMFIKHFPKDFHDDELSLLLRMSDFFNTSFDIRHSLGILDGKNYATFTRPVSYLDIPTARAMKI